MEKSVLFYLHLSCEGTLRRSALKAAGAAQVVFIMAVFDQLKFTYLNRTERGA